MQSAVPEWSAQLGRRLADSGYRSLRTETRTHGPTLGMRRFDFRARWALTGLHTFVLVHEVGAVTAAEVEELAQRSTRIALKAKGGLPRGFQVSVAVLTVIVCRSADRGAVRAAAALPRKRFALVSLPVLVELDHGRFTTPHQPRLWGSYYQDFLGAQQKLVGIGLEGRVLPLGGERRANRWALAGGVVGVLMALVALAVPLLTRLDVF